MIRAITPYRKYRKREEDAVLECRSELLVVIYRANPEICSKMHGSSQRVSSEVNMKRTVRDHQLFIVKADELERVRVSRTVKRRGRHDRLTSCSSARIEKPPMQPGQESEIFCSELW